MSLGLLTLCLSLDRLAVGSNPSKGPSPFCQSKLGNSLLHLFTYLPSEPVGLLGLVPRRIVDPTHHHGVGALKQKGPIHRPGRAPIVDFYVPLPLLCFVVVVKKILYL